jgi:hypothetical protein
MTRHTDPGRDSLVVGLSNLFDQLRKPNRVGLVFRSPRVWKVQSVILYAAHTALKGRRAKATVDLRMTPAALKKHAARVSIVPR